MQRPKIKKGQVWKKKRNGIMFRIDGGGGQDWYGERFGMGGSKPRTHHITAFTLYKEWEFVDTARRINAQNVL